MRAMVVAVLILGGCSFFASTTPVGRTRSCMPGRGSTIADTVVVSVAAIIDLGLVVASQQPGACAGDFGCLGFAADGFVNTVVALPFLAGSIYGFVKDRCPTEVEARVEPRVEPETERAENRQRLAAIRQACLEQRIEIATRAQAIDDVNERAQLLLSMPTCSEESP